MADVADFDEEQRRRLKLLCEVLNEHQVAYVVFGSFAGRLQGAPLRTLDVDVVPEASDTNLQRLCDALNSLAPRWRVDDVSVGLKIDGGKLEPRHIRGSSTAIGLLTRVGMVDIVTEPAGFARGYRDLVGAAVAVDLDGTTVRVGTLDDLIVSKRLLAREKDVEHLPLLEARRAELAREQAQRSIATAKGSAATKTAAWISGSDQESASPLFADMKHRAPLTAPELAVPPAAAPGGDGAAGGDPATLPPS